MEGRARKMEKVVVLGYKGLISDRRAALGLANRYFLTSKIRKKDTLLKTLPDENQPFQ